MVGEGAGALGEYEADEDGLCVTARTNVAGSMASFCRSRKGLIASTMRDEENHKLHDDLSGYKVVRPGNLVVNKMKAWQDHSACTSSMA